MPAPAKVEAAAHRDHFQRIDPHLRGALAAQHMKVRRIMIAKNIAISLDEKRISRGMKHA